MGKKTLLVLVVLVAVLAGASWITMQITPWPKAMVIRWLFDEGAEEASAVLAKHLPTNISQRLDVSYDPFDKDAFVDFYFPTEAEAQGSLLPLIVWVHGGAWISGDKADVGNYARILASRGFVVASVGYSIAPEFQYPTPLRQILLALSFIDENASDYHADSTRVFLAGDSAGAQLVAQTANILTSPTYAEQMEMLPTLAKEKLKGLLLYCGAYDPTLVNFEGSFGGFLNTVFWSYFGTKDFLKDERMKEFSVLQNMTRDFPAMFVSAGNADPLLGQSRALAETATRLGVPVQTLFFAQDHAPGLGHEYQFNLDTAAGQEALQRSVEFMQNQLKKETSL
ncbi:alpha/beta hydrolase [Bdellovibrio bacteriovorus]|uniref:Similar to lipase LipA n=1 Tax=Bdellovibrio bacteriovorus (strain ATCC 15356 / DSM 50701 / NCIMB 9529 / HD100) TaxID=264462 RepID=Q6MQ23_BDEBA|nr:alpha/beta hydrolase [Bdellovibrio bacteriovorus]AHZ86738.1 lipase LipA [Bdellovibrio bacteriovorus]BEV67178.1 Acetyl esterase [Bdellovibrio bacteriovorus]CAE78624.1 similar to lipase LipA [Bdellovibrio bacteriovorus HD100]